MKKYIFLLGCIVSSLSCMSDAIYQKIGEQIYQNETSGNPDLLVFWNISESFPSLGIGHFVWYTEASGASDFGIFPLLCQFLQTNSAELPAWIDVNGGAPWASRDEFYADDVKRADLQQLLLSTFDLQAEFIIQLHYESLTNIMNALHPSLYERVQSTITLLQSTPSGLYGLIDYLHFKGDGIQHYLQSTYKGWGLTQVLLVMPPLGLTVDNAPRAFAACAACILSFRVRNSVPDFNTLQFLPGWVNRVMTYADTSIFNGIA